MLQKYQNKTNCQVRNKKNMSKIALIVCFTTNEIFNCDCIKIKMLL